MLDLRAFVQDYNAIHICCQQLILWLRMNVATNFAGKDSNLHRQIQSPPAYQLADPRVWGEKHKKGRAGPKTRRAPP